jgi:CO/xanthine dehydrogenase Mo-binding subunit
MKKLIALTVNGKRHETAAAPNQTLADLVRYDETLLCVDRARYVGDEIAAVAAVDLETATEAVSLINVEYEELPAVFTPEEALAEGAPQIHDRYPGNLCAEVHQEFGDIEAAFEECDLIRTDTFVNKRQDAVSGFASGRVSFLLPCSHAVKSR